MGLVSWKQERKKDWYPDIFLLLKQWSFDNTYWADSSELKKHRGQHYYGLIWNTAHNSNHTCVKKNKFELKKMEPQEKNSKMNYPLKKPGTQTNKRFLIATEGEESSGVSNG